MQDAYLKSIAALMTDLATEMDLHYEDDDLHAISGTIEILQSAAAILQESGVAVPDCHNHLVNRYLQQKN